jgi:hypothetical protein
VSDRAAVRSAPIDRLTAGDELDQPAPIPRGTEYAAVIESNQPVVVQHTRLDSRQAENALLSTIAYTGSG